MKVKLTKDQLVGFVNREAGEVVDVDPRRAEHMIKAKHAVRVNSKEDDEIESPPDLASKATLEAETGRKPVVPLPELTGEMNPPKAVDPKAVRVTPVEEPRRVVVEEGSPHTAEVKDVDPKAAAKAVDEAKDPKKK